MGRRNGWVLSAPALPLWVAAAGCTGNIGDANEGPGTPASYDPGIAAPAPVDPTADPALPGRALAATSRLRRLTVDEYDNTLRDLLGDSTRPGSRLLPADTRAPFDNDYTTQMVSSAFVNATDLLASDAVNRLLLDRPRRDRIVGCKPTGPGDTACLSDFIKRFGRRALRRPLTPDEVSEFTTLSRLAQTDGDFYSAAAAIVEVMLQHPELLYRVETGSPVPGAPGLYRLGGFEVASRLSFFLWGTMPDDPLLALAEARGLDSAAGVRTAAAAMLTRTPLASGLKPPAVEQVARFHAQWFGAGPPMGGALTGAMLAETKSLFSRVIFEKKRPWQELLRSTETYVNYDLAKHYGLSLPSLPGFKAGATRAEWVPYTNTRRRGLLSHASFLALGASPDGNQKVMTIRRGKLISERLLCTDVPPKPAMAAPPEKPVLRTPCKQELLAAHRTGGCAGCHALLDAVGLGLDNYDTSGAYRASESWKFTDASKTDAAAVPPGTAGAVSCAIGGDGVLEGQPFNGPAGLADLMLASSRLDTCVATQVYRFALGRTQMDDTDKRFVDMVAKRLGGGDFRFDELLLDLVSSDAFLHVRRN